MPFPVTCPACGKSFSISDEIYEQKIKGRVVSVKCKQCQSAIRVDGTKSAAPARSAAPPPSPVIAGATNGSEVTAPKAPAAPQSESVAEAPKPVTAPVADPTPAKDALTASPPAEVAPPTASPVQSTATGRESPAATVPSPASPPAPPPENAILFAVDSPDGTDRELTTTEIARELREGKLSEDTLVWRDGMAEWLEIKKVPELAGFLKKPEPAKQPAPKAASSLSGNKSAGAPAALNASGRFRPRQPTLPMGAIPGPAEATGANARERTAAGAESSKARSSGGMDPRPAAMVDTRPDVRTARSSLPSDPLGRPGASSLGNVPRIPSSVPSSDDEPTVLRAPEAVAELLNASLDARDELTPVPPRMGAARTNSRAAAPQPGVSTGLPPLPPRTSGGPLPGPRAGSSDRTARDGRPTPSPSLPSVGTTTQQLTSFSMPGTFPDASPKSPAQQKPPVDTFRESPEAKRAWFPEEVPGAPAFAQAPAPPAPPPPIPAHNPFLAAHPPAPPMSPVPSAPSHLPDAMMPLSVPMNSVPESPAPVPPIAARPMATATVDDAAFRSKRGKGIWIVLVLLVLAAAGAAYFYLVKAPIKPPPPPPPPQPAAEAPRVPETPNTDPTAAAEPAPTVEATAGMQPDPGRSPLDPPSNATGPRSGEFADMFAEGAKRAAGSGDRFDPKVGKAALESLVVDAARCRERGGPVGMTDVIVTFEPGGSVSGVEVEDAPIAGTSIAACIATVFKRAKIAPFTGTPGSVTQRLAIQ